jgi:Ca2+:H+ antiporter
VGRRFLWASLGLAPLTIASHFILAPSDTVDFILSALSLVPLAWLIGEATEQTAHHTGPGIGGFLNATFGNAPELKFDVVRGSLSGSVIGNLLLVLGFSFLFGGRGELDRRSSFSSLGLVALAVLLFLIPAVPAFHGDPERRSIAELSIAPSILLLFVYLGVTWLSLRRHRELHRSSDGGGAEGWLLSTAVVVLGAATAVTALIAEILVGSIDAFAHNVGLSKFFVAAIIVAIVGNAAEHGGAVVVAARGRIKLAAEIAFASSAQVAVFLAPAVALLAWAIQPLALSFRPAELIAVGASAALAGALIADGRSSRRRGGALVAAYGVVAIAFLAVGDR